MDFDRDGDGVKNGVDVAPDDASEWADDDGDGIFDNADDDKDNDGLTDDVDPLPLTPSADMTVIALMPRQSLNTSSDLSHQVAWKASRILHLVRAPGTTVLM